MRVFIVENSVGGVKEYRYLLLTLWTLQGVWRFRWNFRWEVLQEAIISLFIPFHPNFFLRLFKNTFSRSVFDRRRKVSTREIARIAVKKIFLKVIVPSLHVSRKGVWIRQAIRGQLIPVYNKNCDERRRKKRGGRERRKMMKDRASCNMHRIYNTGKSRFIVNLRIPITIPLSALCKDFFQLETFSKPLNSSRWNWLLQLCVQNFVRRALFGRRR